MKKKRNIFLFGAGATLEWGSPLTSELTDLIRNYSFITSDNKTTATDYIYQKLLANGYSEKEINFETILSVLEELIIYYSPFNKKQKISSLLSCFFTASFNESEFFNYSIKGGVEKHGYELQIPRGIDYEMAKPCYNNETPNQFFLQHLMADLLSTISSRISKYAYHTHTHSAIDATTEISRNFIHWMETLSQDGILRLYTLNYDRIFKVLFSRIGTVPFEGFDADQYVMHFGRGIRANVLKILSDTESHIHYNLHGCVSWEVLRLDKDILPNPEIVLTKGIPLQVNDNVASFQVEKGKTLLVTNIISGYQKAQKGMITPFKQMQAAFDKDCCFADEIFIIGYSFGDEHINESIKTALRHNENVKITIVDPYFIKNNMDEQLAFKIFPFRQKNDYNPFKVQNHENLYTYFGEAFTVHTVSFKEFLELKISQQIL